MHPLELQVPQGESVDKGMYTRLLEKYMKLEAKIYDLKVRHEYAGFLITRSMWTISSMDQKYDLKIKDDLVEYMRQETEIEKKRYHSQGE